MTRAVAVALLPLALLAACGSPPAPSGGSSSSAAAPSASAATSEPAAFDFARTAWRVEAIDGQPVAVGAAPTLAFDAREGAKGSGVAFSGCSSFGVEWALEGGRAQIRPQGVDLGTCTGIAAQVEAAFLARLVAATSYSMNGDVLILSGPAGQIQLRRDAPPIGDPGRVVLDLLRTGEWRVVAAPGIAAGKGPTGIRFADTRVISTGDCGFGAIYRVLPQAGIKFEELGWDTVGADGVNPCGDAREVLKKLLEGATTARVGADGATVVISGPKGDVVLGR